MDSVDGACRSGHCVVETEYGAQGLVIRTLAYFLLVVVAALLSGTARAEPVVVPADEISKLLTGNTIRGTWYGEEYKQYFMADGVTIYAPRKSQSTRGKWRVNTATNTYESWWERSGWSGYQVVRENGALFWLQKDTENQPFEILLGEQLVWPPN